MACPQQCSVVVYCIISGLVTCMLMLGVEPGWLQLQGKCWERGSPCLMELKVLGCPSGVKPQQRALHKPCGCVGPRLCTRLCVNAWGLLTTDLTRCCTRYVQDQAVLMSPSLPDAGGGAPCPAPGVLLLAHPAALRVSWGTGVAVGGRRG